MVKSFMREARGPDARDYGVQVNKTGSDSTAAMQAFVTDVTTNNLAGRIPDGIIDIAGTITVPARSGWAIRGGGGVVSTIRQQANNVPIFTLGASTSENMFGYELSGFQLTYGASQPSTNTLATPLFFQASTFESTLRDLRFSRGAYGIKVIDGQVPPWGCSFDDLVFGGGLTIGAMDWSGGINAVPNNKFGRIFVDCANMVGPVFLLRGYAWTIDTIEFVSANLGPRLMDFAAGSMVTIGGLKLEIGTYNNAGTTALFRFNTGVSANIGHIHIGGLTMVVGAGATLYAIESGVGGPGTGYVKVENLRVIKTGGSGSAYAFQVAESAAAGNVELIGGWGLTNAGSSDAADRLTVESWQRPRPSPDLGNADYTATLGGPTILIAQTALTAPRTINLPSTPANMPGGLAYTVISSGAVNGANTLVVKAGTTTLATVSVDKTALTLTWRRGATGAGSWIVTAAQSLP